MNTPNLIRTVVFLSALVSLPPLTQASLINLGKLFGPAPIQLDASPTPEKSVSVDSFKQMSGCKKVVVT
jgi:hypothetical protein